VPEASVLETTAEVAVAFAGFIGIVLILASRDDRFPVRDSLQIRVIVVSSVTPVFYAAVPLVLFFLGVSGSVLWRTSSGLAAVAGATLTAHLVPQLRVVPPAERPSMKSPNSVIAWALTVIAMACWLANALAWPWVPSGGMHLLAVWSVLGIAGVNFVALIYRKVL
jgi:hypothetical protein